MESVTKLVDKYGPEIAKSLDIATTQVTAKVLWYVRVSGIKDFTLDIIFILIGILFAFLTVSFSRKLSDENEDNVERGMRLFVVGAIAFAVWLFVCFIVIDETVNDAMKIISPEYWVIDQAVNKLITK